MVFKDFHIHTDFSDGQNSAEEMVLAAISMGMKTMGFSDHSYAEPEDVFGMSKENIAPYKAEIARLKAKYNGKIEILCGIEQDCFSTESTVDYDYVIGSVHYVKIKDEYISVDWSAEVLKDAADKYFGGDIYALTDLYFETVANVVEMTHPDIIGHFDLISKFCEPQTARMIPGEPSAAAINSETPQAAETDFCKPPFDVNNPRYISAWKKAADKLLSYGIPFEINTGAISRGYRTTPYPSAEIIKYLSARGAKFIFSSDAHSKDAICFKFETLAGFSQSLAQDAIS